MERYATTGEHAIVRLEQGAGAAPALLLAVCDADDVEALVALSPADAGDLRSVIVEWLDVLFDDEVDAEVAS